MANNLAAATEAEDVDMLRSALKAAEELLTQNTSMTSSFRLGKEISSVCTTLLEIAGMRPAISSDPISQLCQLLMPG